MIIQLIILNIFFVDLQYKLSGKLDTQMSQKLFLHREALYTEKLLHTAAFARRSFHAERPLHIAALSTEAFTQRSREAFTQSSFYTQKQRNLYQ